MCRVDGSGVNAKNIAGTESEKRINKSQRTPRKMCRNKARKLLNIFSMLNYTQKECKINAKELTM